MIAGGAVLLALATTMVAGATPALAGVPSGVPLAVQVTAGKKAVVVNWTPPVSGTAVNHYVATATSTNPVGTKTCASAGTAPTCTISTVTANVTYTVAVISCPTASNTTDCSIPSVPSGSVTPGPPNSPSKPTVAYTEAGGEVRVSWTEPTPINAAIDSFLVTPTPVVANAAGSCVQTLNADARTCLFDGLVAGTSYTFKVTAVGVGSTGSSIASTASNSIVAGPPGKPGKPTVLRNDSDTELLVNWSAPADGGPATGYTVAAVAGVDSATVPDDCGANPNLRSCVVEVGDATAPYTFHVMATGGGDSVWSDTSDPIVPGKPGVPGTPTVELTGPGEATVSWEAPVDGSPVVSYTVSSVPAATVPDGCGTDLGVLSCDLSDLQLNTPYTFKVTAHSDAGVATDSDVSDSVVVSAPGTPGTPSVVVTSAGNATVRWTAPNDGGPINGYTVISDPAATVPAGCGDDIAVRSCAFTGLDPTVAYTFQVEAVGPAGFTDSAITAPVTPGAPGVPGTPTVSLTTPGSATVNWAAPTTGGPVTSYALTSNQTVTVPLNCAAPDGLTCTLTGLDPTLPYTFQVTATGPAGTTPSATSSPAVRPAAPDTPAAPTVVLGATPGTATVSWPAPTTGGPVTSYTLTSNQTVTVPGGCTALEVRSCLFTDLDPSLSYWFKVTAVGPLGSPISAASSPAVTPDAPGTPGTPGVVLGATPGTATVSWAAPLTGGPVTSYTVTSNHAVNVPSGCTALNVRSCVFTDLDPTLSYTFTVTATGPSGTTPSATSSPAVKPDKPGTPATPAVTLGVNPGTATVTWGTPTTGGPVTSYTLTANQSVTVPLGCTDLGVRHCDLTGLDPGLSYAFTVTAVGPAGTTAANLTAVKPDKPGAPGTPTIANGVPGSVTVTWDAPTAGGPVDSYSVTSLPVVTAPGGCTGTTNLTCVFSGLDPTETYTFQVTATGPSGSRPSALSLPVTPGAPSAPGTPTAVVTGPDTVRVSWTASPVGGGVVTGYTVTSDPAVLPPLGCTMTTSLTCDFNGLDASKSYTFLVTAVGGAGRTSSVARSAPVTLAQAGVPGTPTVQLAAEGTVKVTWTAPAGGGVVTGYTVTSDPAVSPSCVNIQVLSCLFSGLDTATSYTFLVTANGPAGSTPSIARSTAIRPALPGVPDAPTVMLAGPNAVTVRWNAPATGGPVAGYSVLSDPALTAPPGCTNVPVFACTFDRLISGTPYTFRVVAAGPFGMPAMSSPSAPLIPGPPATPNKPMVALTGVANQVKVSWTAPNEGAGIAGYVVQSSPGLFGCDVPATSATTACLVSGLDPATAYTFRVQATGVPNSGDSAFSVRSDPLTPGALSPPTDVNVAAGDRQIAVSWTAPGNAGVRVAYYRATTTPGGATCQTVNAVATDCVITGLTNLTSYTVAVVAVGVDGTADSAPSAPSIRVRPTAGPPGAPASVTASGRDQAIVVSWRAPASIGDGISHYVATASGDPDGLNCITADAVALTCTITGLTNGRQYNVTVVAVGKAASGNSGPSSPPVAVTLDVAPSTPTAVTATAGSADLTVRFTAGSGGGPVANFTATATGGASTGPCTTTNGTTTSCVITGVIPGTSYTVTVVANGVTIGLHSGTSQASAAVTALSLPAVALPLSVPSGTTALTSSARTLTVGTVTTISGSGYAPYSGVTLGTFPGPVTLPAVITDSTGAFSVQLTISGAAGARTFVAAGRTSAGVVRYQTLPVTILAPV